MYKVFCGEQLYAIAKNRDLATSIAVQCINRNYGRYVTVERGDKAIVYQGTTKPVEKQIRPKNIATTIYELIEAMGYEPAQMVGVVVKDEAPTLIAFYPKDISEDRAVTMNCVDKEYDPAASRDLAALDMDTWLQLAMHKAGGDNAH